MVTNWTRGSSSRNSCTDHSWTQFYKRARISFSKDNGYSFKYIQAAGLSKLQLSMDVIKVPFLVQF